jgi:hypothetical protein
LKPHAGNCFPNTDRCQGDKAKRHDIQMSHEYDKPVAMAARDDASEVCPDIVNTSQRLTKKAKP